MQINISFLKMHITYVPSIVCTFTIANIFKTILENYNTLITCQNKIIKMLLLYNIILMRIFITLYSNYKIPFISFAIFYKM